MVSPINQDRSLKNPVITPRRRLFDVSRPETSKRETSATQTSCQSHANTWKETNSIGGEEKLLDSGVHRCHSSLSQRSALTSPPEESLGRAVRACHSQPLSMIEVILSANTQTISLYDVCCCFLLRKVFNLLFARGNKMLGNLVFH